MNKIILNKQDITKIGDWNISKDNIINTDKCPFKDIELFIQGKHEGESISLKCYRKETYVNIYVAVDGIAKGKIRVNTEGEVIQNKLIRKLDTDQLESIYGVYFTLMNYIAEYRPEKVLEVKESNTSVSNHRNSKKKVTNTTYLFSSSFSARKGGHHASPSYSFSVRGHYRHLKNGKVIWVKEHTKGNGKEKKGHEYRI